MITYNFTDRVQQVLRIAREEAARRHHNYVGTEHVVLAMIEEGQGVGAATLKQLDLEFAALRHDIENRIQTADRVAPPEGPDYNENATRMFELATSEAQGLKHSFVGTEHLLLGILREGEGIGARVLIDAGVTLEAARREVLLLNGEGFGEIL